MLEGMETSTIPHHAAAAAAAEEEDGHEQEHEQEKGQTPEQEQEQARGSGPSPVALPPAAAAPDASQNQVAHDSMVTVRLSEPPALTVETAIPSPPQSDSKSESESESGPSSTGGGSEEVQTPGITLDGVQEDEAKHEAEHEAEHEASPGVVTMEESRSESASEGSEVGSEVNWEELEKTEDQEPRDESSDDSTALLLARLEQENAALVSNPKAGIVQVAVVESVRSRHQSRPPSLQHLKRLVNGPTPARLRYSVIPPPPMTDLEFWAALVQDYTRTAQRLPTLFSKKIRSGIPPPLRGVVWQSMSGARDPLLEEQFERLCGESSPYEGIIGKDLGRSFPGVEMFRDPDGDGQRMLGRVLKCFSLYDHKIGYCQGLGFLVGPLLMHMGDKQAFCVLVRLMEHYDLRSCFLPDLSGLHVRIYQFKKLLGQHLPALSAYLERLGVEPAYVSQWFLSFFAVTCPLPMLFRIYDVVFAEGASETIMRVALSLMRKNQDKIMACTEFEDVMQLLLSRGLWDVYHYNADAFVNEFGSMTGLVTRESLQALEGSYREAQTTDAVTPTDIGSVASRFLGRLWTGANLSKQSTSLSSGLAAPSRPASFLRRSPSKQSLASTLNSMEGGASESVLSASTDATSISRDSSNADNASLRAQSTGFSTTVPKPNKDKNLHGQIEDLLVALSELQRDHAILATQLQREREEREEDRHAVRSLLDGLRKKTSSETVGSERSDGSLETVKAVPQVDADDDGENDQTIVPGRADTEDESLALASDDLSTLLEVMEGRFRGPPDGRRSSILQTKSQLRDDVVRAKEQLIHEVAKTQDLTRRLAEHQQEIQNLKDQVRDGHGQIRAAHQDKQRLERQMHELKARKSSTMAPDGTRDHDTEGPNSSSGPSGLRGFKLGRSASDRSPKAPTVFNKRTSSLATTREKEPPMPGTSSPPGATQDDTDALVLELVQAKTAEAIAKQEAEEAKSKLESLRKLLGVAGEGKALGHRPTGSGHSILSVGSGGGAGGYVSRPQPQSQVSAPVGVPTTSTVGSGGGGFWGGWGKKAISAEKIPGTGGR